VENQDTPITYLFPGFDWQEAKIHVAQKSDNEHPIDCFVQSFDQWQNGWNGNFHSNHCWNRQFVFSMIELPKQTDKWLFGGVFRVVSHKPGKSRTGKQGVIYQVELTDFGQPLIGRLLSHWTKDARAKGRRPETMLENMSIAELLPEKYAGEDFPGYGNINHSYAVLENLWREGKPDWVAALSHSQGIYMITDTKTGLRYVGSAYGEEGIWSRWGTYFATGGHGNNKLLKKLLRDSKQGADYARENFMISLLEQASTRDDEKYILKRESYWKQTLLTRGIFGLNEN
jgi:hypothetical protein